MHDVTSLTHSPLRYLLPSLPPFPLLLPHWLFSCFHVFPTSGPLLMLFHCLETSSLLLTYMVLVHSDLSSKVSAIQRSLPSPPIYTASPVPLPHSILSPKYSHKPLSSPNAAPKSVTSALGDLLQSLSFHTEQRGRRVSSTMQKAESVKKDEDLLVLVLSRHFQFHAFPPWFSLCSKIHGLQEALAKKNIHTVFPTWIHSTVS